MRAAYLPEWDAYIRCHDLPGEDPARVYRGVGRCELIGHSMGGSVAILVAGERPELVHAWLSPRQIWIPALAP